ncbi:MAG: molybdenum cofactor biosynthesis protein MoaE [Deltaproteobacteria bacterium]|nr:molybdenum cofactor biosynthesis protein MoaE [Deltaproteobacteria bacterium]
MFEVREGPLDVAEVRGAVEDPSFGAVLVFVGVTRDHFEGHHVTHLSYDAYPEMAVPVMAQIADEMRERWECRVAMVHRVGEVPVGEASVVIAVSAPHRAECYEASRYAIDELKKRVPVWKKENYEDGSVWKANSPT